MAVSLSGGTSAVLTNNVIRDLPESTTCVALIDLVRFTKLAMGMSGGHGPTIQNNTLEFETRVAMPPAPAVTRRRGLAIIGVAGSSASGVVRSNIIRNTGAGTVFADRALVYESGATGSADLMVFDYNDLYDPVAGATLYFNYNGPGGPEALTTIAPVNEVAGGGMYRIGVMIGGSNIGVLCALDATWHLTGGMGNACVNAGAAAGITMGMDTVGTPPLYDFDRTAVSPGTLRVGPDIGADED